MHMDTTRWKHGDSFETLDLIAKFRFKCSSIPGSMSESPSLPRSNEKLDELYEISLNGLSQQTSTEDPPSDFYS